MILENVFLKEIQLKIGDVDEFIEKCWYALNIDKEYPEEEIGNNAFRDWARDLDWIEQEVIIIIIKGNLQDSVRRTIGMINNYWESNKSKRVDFIIVG